MADILAKLNSNIESFWIELYFPCFILIACMKNCFKNNPIFNHSKFGSVKCELTFANDIVSWWGDTTKHESQCSFFQSNVGWISCFVVLFIVKQCQKWIDRFVLIWASSWFSKEQGCVALKGLFKWSLIWNGLYIF